MIDMTFDSSTDELGHGEFTDILCREEKQHLKGFTINLRWRLSRHATAINRKVVGASPMAWEATPGIPLLVSTTSEVTSVDLQLGIVALVVVAIGQ